jgi:hypothetical protein
MSGHVIVHRPPDVALKAQLTNLRVAAVKRWRIERTRVELTKFVMTTPHRPWVTEDELKARRPRHLLEDNPCSG